MPILENAETKVGLALALACNNIAPGIKKALEGQTKEAGRRLSYLMHQPEKFGSKL